MARKREQRVSLNDDTQTDDPAHRADVPISVSSADNADPGAARSHVHSVRPIGSIVGERFVLKAHLGRGRLGERYGAVDRSLSDPDVASERSVVLHFLSSRIAQQTRLLQKLETSYHHPHSWAHRNLVGILGFGSDRGEYYFVTEDLEGGTLRTILDEVAPEVPPEEETFSVIGGIGDALKYAHAKGVVHGDLRPENVFVTRDLVVKVLDLLPATVPRTVAMFPEDNGAKGPVPDPRDDVYGLACIAYELFAGKHPFNSNTALEAFSAGLRPAPILSLDPRSWSALVGGLALRREERTASVAAFLADLGVTGRERLRRASEADRAAMASAAPPAAAPRIDADDWSDLSDKTVETVGVSRPRARAASASSPIANAPNIGEPDIEPRYELYRARGYERRPTTSRRWLAWAAILAIGGAVYWNHGWLQEHGPEWLAMGRDVVDKAVRGNQDAAPRVASGATASADAAASSATPPLANPSPPVPGPERANGGASGSGAAKGVVPSGAAPSVAPAPKDERPPKESSVPPREANVAPQNSTAPAREASPVARDTSALPPAATPDTSSSQSTQVQRAAIAGQPVPAEIFEPEKPVVVVSEAAPSAAITIRRHGSLDAATSFVWWTTDGTAVADEDYINLGARIEKLAAGEQTRTIYVPIVHDSKPEGRESFYVNVRPGQGGKRQDPAERVEVVIEDDD